MNTWELVLLVWIVGLPTLVLVAATAVVRLKARRDDALPWREHDQLAEVIPFDPVASRLRASLARVERGAHGVNARSHAPVA